MTPRLLAWELNSCIFIWAAITKYHRLGTLNSENLFFHGPGGWKSKVRVSTALVASEASPWLPSGSVFTWYLLFACTSLVPCVSVCVQFPYLVRTPIRLDKAHLNTSF